MTISGHGFAHAYNRLLTELRQAPESSPRGMLTKELVGVQLRIVNPLSRLAYAPGRRLSLPFAIAETLWIWSGRDDLAYVARYNKRYAQFSDDGKTLYGAYGSRAKEQLDRVVQQLTNDHDSRQAVVAIYDANDGVTITKDVPCTQGWQFLLREGKLSMICTMRSNDVFWGLPYDLFANTMIQEWMAKHIGVAVGEYIHQAGSMHAYERHFSWLEHRYEEVIMPPMEHTSDMRQLHDIESAISSRRHVSMHGRGRWVSDIALVLDAYWDTPVSRREGAWFDKLLHDSPRRSTLSSKVREEVGG